MSNNIDNASNIGEPNVADKSVNLEAKPRKEKSPSALSVYLGSAEESARRMKTLDDIAERLNLRGRSTLIQWIADGRLQLVVPPTRYEGPEQELNASPWRWTPLFNKVSAKSDMFGHIIGDAPVISEEQKAEIRRYIEENIESFAENKQGWYAVMAATIREKLELTLDVDEINIIWQMVSEEAERRNLYPYNSPKKSRRAAEGVDKNA